MSYFLRTPRQASNIFGLSGSSPPRPKNLFFVNFSKASDTTYSQSTASDWQKGLSFVVKAVDRPAIQPVVEELNQYNKRRQVNVGYKVQPMKIIFYDTVDNIAGQMWNDYVTHYFGDFRHSNNRDDFRYDVTTAQFKDSGGGYGFAPLVGSQPELDDNSPYYFDKISVYSVYGGEFTQFDVINPKISSFDPDDYNYEDSQIATFNMVVNYEALLYVNNGIPQAISSDATVSEAFDGAFDGQVID